MCLTNFFQRGLSFCPASGRKSHPTSIVADTRRLNGAAETAVEGTLLMSADESDPLVATNDFFHVAYSDARNELIPKVNIMRQGDYLVLHLKNGSRIVEPIVHDIFHNLKMVAHLPLGAYSVLLANTSKSISLDQSSLDKLSSFQLLLQEVIISSDLFPDNEEQLTRQQQIYQITVDFVIAVLQSSKCSLDQLADFAWSVSSAVNLNLDEAAEDNINTTHAVVMQWKAHLLTAQDWEDLYTVVAVGCVPCLILTAVYVLSSRGIPCCFLCCLTLTPVVRCGVGI